MTNKPTPWLNPLVVALKGGNDARLCLDMRNANTSIERTRFPLPTVDELIVKLRKCNPIFKIRFKSRPYKLDPESCYITAFQTEDCIKDTHREKAP